MIKKKIGIDLDNTIINYNNAFTKFLKKKKINLKEINKIKIIRYKEPYFCSICKTITNKSACRHISTDPESIEYISGSKIRSLLANGLKPQHHHMRPEVVEKIYSKNMFVK